MSALSPLSDGVFYSVVTDEYGQAKKRLDQGVGNLEAALITVVRINEPDVKIELLNSFNSVLKTHRQILLKNILPAVKRMNTHILTRGGFGSIDAFLKQEGLTVNQGWAELSSLVGESISAEFVV